MSDKITRHELNCSAPICVKDSNLNYKNEVVWYPGEAICKVRPYCKFQNKQIKLNKQLKKGILKNPYSSYIVKDLE